MKRTALIFLTTLSTLLCITTALFWARSYWRQDYWFLTNQWTVKVDHDPGDEIWTRDYSLTINRGRMGFKYELDENDDVQMVYENDDVPPPPPPSPQDGWRSGWVSARSDQTWDAVPGRMGFAWVHEGPFHGVHNRGEYWILTVPLWLPFALFASWPAWRTTRWWKRRETQFRAKNGLCLACGYDLRATPDRCPECGNAISPAKA